VIQAALSPPASADAVSVIITGFVADNAETMSYELPNTSLNDCHLPSEDPQL
jgi:hypothetical protein